MFHAALSTLLHEKLVIFLYGRRAERVFGAFCIVFLPDRHALSVLFFVFGNIFETTIQNVAQPIQRIGIDVFVFAQSVQLPCAESVFLDQLILGHTLFFHRDPQPFK
jgi:hypothetical protein